VRRRLARAPVGEEGGEPLKPGYFGSVGPAEARGVHHRIDGYRMLSTSSDVCRSGGFRRRSRGVWDLQALKAGGVPNDDPDTAELPAQVYSAQPSDGV
jgi:hypothetical protein